MNENTTQLVERSSTIGVEHHTPFGVTQLHKNLPKEPPNTPRIFRNGLICIVFLHSKHTGTSLDKDWAWPRVQQHSRENVEDASL
ncbi:MAG: hypothetical protein AAGJ35_07510, partial [Myxococcota bacterium]